MTIQIALEEDLDYLDWVAMTHQVRASELLASKAYSHFYRCADVSVGHSNGGTYICVSSDSFLY
jgi:hypothetical protein